VPKNGRGSEINAWERVRRTPSLSQVKGIPVVKLRNKAILQEGRGLRFLTATRRDVQQDQGECGTLPKKKRWRCRKYHEEGASSQDSSRSQRGTHSQCGGSLNLVPGGKGKYRADLRRAGEKVSLGKKAPPRRHCFVPAKYTKEG